MAIDQNDPNLIFRRLDETDSDEITGWSGVENEEYRDHWWAVDPERGLIFWRRGYGPASPQVHRFESMSRRLTSVLYPWAEVRQLAYVHVRTHNNGRVRVLVIEADEAEMGCYACMVGVWTGPESHARGCAAAKAPAPEESF